MLSLAGNHAVRSSAFTWYDVRGREKSTEIVSERPEFFGILSVTLPTLPDVVPPAHPILDRLLEVAKVAHRLDTNPRFIWRLIREGRLPAYRLGTRWRVKEADLVAYIAACKHDHTNPGDDRAPGRESTPAIIGNNILDRPRRS